MESYNRAVIIHGHAYQPPRGNPDPASASYGMHSAGKDWNKEITEQCYTPNAKLGNFSNMSFDLAPTLAEYLRMGAPETLRMIVEQDATAVETRGAGTAMSHPYHHIILPLADEDDIATEIHWGNEYFSNLFGRPARGLWLPETAVDGRTLSIAAEEGIEFTILGENQVKAQDFRKPYRVRGLGGVGITVFPFSGMSGSASYEDYYTENADNFVENYLMPLFDERAGRQFVMLASDLELYGHHKKLREYFIEYLTKEGAKKHGVEVSYPELWLKEKSGSAVTEIIENSAWSCTHSLARWTRGCECTNEGDEALNGWKYELRAQVVKASYEMNSAYDRATEGIIGDSRELLDDYIHVMLGNNGMEQLIEKHSTARAAETDIRLISAALKMQEARLASFTSCGWFFENGNGLEPKIIMDNMNYGLKLAGIINDVLEGHLSEVPGEYSVVRRAA